jgi:hypothetical protein
LYYALHACEHERSPLIPLNAGFRGLRGANAPAPHPPFVA